MMTQELPISDSGQVLSAWIRKTGFHVSRAEVDRQVKLLVDSGFTVFNPALRVLNTLCGLELTRKYHQYTGTSIRILPELMMGELEWCRMAAAEVGEPICPIGEYADAALLFVTSDGRAFAHFESLSFLANSIEELVVEELRKPGRRMV